MIEADPFILGHEQTILSRLINYQDSWVSLSHFEEDYFSDPKHRHIFRAIVAVITSGQRPVPAAIDAELRRSGQFNAVGGNGAVTSISLVTATDAITEFAASELQDRYRRKRTAQIAEKMQRGEMTPNEAQAALAAISDETRGEGHGLSVRSAGEILTLQMDEHDCLMGDRVLAKGQPLTIIGPGGIGKSRALLQMAAACITGQPWCGIPTHAKGLKWLIVQTENNNRRLQADLNAIKKWVGEDWPLVADLLYIKTLENDRDGFLSLGDPQTVKRLSDLITEVSPDIVAFDPLRDIMDGDPNQDQDMSATLQKLGAISRRGNPTRTTVVLHHALTGRKSASSAFGMDRSSYGRNSKALFGWTRAQINFSPGAEDNNETVIISCGKNSNGKEFESVAVMLNSQTMIYEVDDLFDMDGWRSALRSNRPAGKTKPRRVELVAPLLDAGPLSQKDLVNAVMATVPCKSSRAYALIEAADDAKFIKWKPTQKVYAQP